MTESHSIAFLSVGLAFLMSWNAALLVSIKHEPNQPPRRRWETILLVGGWFFWALLLWMVVADV